MGRGMITSIDTATQVSITFRKKEKLNKNMGIQNITQTTHAKMAINVYEYGIEGGAYTCLDTHTQVLEYYTRFLTREHSK